MGSFNARLVIKVKIDFGKPLQEVNFFVSFISSGSKFTLQIRLALVTRLQIQLILQFRGVKLS